MQWRQPPPPPGRGRKPPSAPRTGAGRAPPRRGPVKPMRNTRLGRPSCLSSPGPPSSCVSGPPFSPDPPLRSRSAAQWNSLPGLILRPDMRAKPFTAKFMRIIRSPQPSPGPSGPCPQSGRGGLPPIWPGGRSLASWRFRLALVLLSVAAARAGVVVDLDAAGLPQGALSSRTNRGTAGGAVASAGTVPVTAGQAGGVPFPMLIGAFNEASGSVSGSGDGLAFAKILILDSKLTSQEVRAHFNAEAARSIGSRSSAAAKVTAPPWVTSRCTSLHRAGQTIRRVAAELPRAGGSGRRPAGGSGRAWWSPWR